jgi:hypothetical protein
MSNIKSNAEKSEKQRKEKITILEKQETNFHLRKATLAFNVKKLEDDERKYLEEQKLSFEKKLVASTIETFQSHNTANDTLNEESLDDLAELLSSTSLSEKESDINDKEGDPSTSSNNYTEKLVPIRPILKSFPRVLKRSFVANWYDTYDWLEYSIKENLCFCFACRYFDTNDKVNHFKAGISIDKNISTKLTKHSQSKHSQI